MLLVMSVLAIYIPTFKHTSQTTVLLSPVPSLPLENQQVGHSAQLLVRKSLEAKVAKWKSVVLTDLHKLQKAVSVNPSESEARKNHGGDMSDASTNFSPATTTHNHPANSRNEGAQSLENQQHELERWEAALQQQMALQCLSSARQHAPADRAAAERRCEGRVIRRARSSLHKLGSAPAQIGSGASMAKGRSGPRRSAKSRGFTQLRVYKPIAIEQASLP
jgi:hypothetical protein